MLGFPLDSHQYITNSFKEALQKTVHEMCGNYLYFQRRNSISKKLGQFFSLGKTKRNKLPVPDHNGLTTSFNLDWKSLRLMVIYTDIQLLYEELYLHFRDCSLQCQHLQYFFVIVFSYFATAQAKCIILFHVHIFGMC